MSITFAHRLRNFRLSKKIRIRFDFLRFHILIGRDGDYEKPENRMRRFPTQCAIALTLLDEVIHSLLLQKWYPTNLESLRQRCHQQGPFMSRTSCFAKPPRLPQIYLSSRMQRQYPKTTQPTLPPPNQSQPENKAGHGEQKQRNLD